MVMSGLGLLHHPKNHDQYPDLFWSLSEKSILFHTRLRRIIMFFYANMSMKRSLIYRFLVLATIEM